MNCSDIQEHMSEYLDGTLPAKERRLFDSHVESCGKCSREIREMKATLALLDSVPEIDPPADFVAQVRTRINDGDVETEDSETTKVIEMPTPSPTRKRSWFNRPEIQVAIAACFVGMITLVGLLNKSIKAPGMQTESSMTDAGLAVKPNEGMPAPSASDIPEPKSEPAAPKDPGTLTESETVSAPRLMKMSRGHEGKAVNNIQVDSIQAAPAPPVTAAAEVDVTEGALRRGSVQDSEIKPSAMVVPNGSKQALRSYGGNTEAIQSRESDIQGFAPNTVESAPEVLADAGPTFESIDAKVLPDLGGQPEELEKSIALAKKAPKASRMASPQKQADKIHYFALTDSKNQARLTFTLADANQKKELDAFIKTLKSVYSKKAKMGKSKSPDNDEPQILSLDIPTEELEQVIGFIASLEGAQTIKLTMPDGTAVTNGIPSLITPSDSLRLDAETTIDESK